MKKNGGLLTIGIITTIWSASRGMNALAKALNRSYLKEETRSFIIVRGMSIVFTAMLIVVILIALLLPVFGQQIGVLAFSYFGLEQSFMKLWGSLRWTIPPVLIFIVFSVIYWLVPNLTIRLKTVFPGAAFATIGWIVTSLAFSFYVRTIWQLFEHVWKYWGNHCPYDLAIFFCYYPHGRRSN